MMTLKAYLKDKSIHGLMMLIMLLLIWSMMMAFQLNRALILSVILVIIFFMMIIIVYDYQRQISFYRFYQKQLEQLDKKYLICELLREPDFLTGQILYQSLYEINKSMLERIN